MSTATSAPIIVSALVIRNSLGEVLTVRKRGTTGFMLPGGKPEPGETAEETARREAAEAEAAAQKQALEADAAAHAAERAAREGAGTSAPASAPACEIPAPKKEA